MDRLWDTTFASRIQPGSELMEYVIEQSIRGTPVAVAAPSLLEMSYGFQLKASAGDSRFKRLGQWLTRFASSQTLSVIPLDERSALVAGRLRADCPHPPPKRDRRSKTMRQATWIFDLQIAAIAFTSGLDIATASIRDFKAIGQALEESYPEAPPLRVFDRPERPDQGFIP